MTRDVLDQLLVARHSLANILYRREVPADVRSRCEWALANVKAALADAEQTT